MSFKPQLVAEAEPFASVATLADIKEDTEKRNADEAARLKQSQIDEIESRIKRPDILEMIRSKPAPMDFVLPGLRAKTAGALISPGGVGKSFLGLQLGLLVAAGFDSFATPKTGLSSGLPGLTARDGWNGLKTGKVAYFSIEDDSGMFWQRINAIFSAFGLDENDPSNIQRRAKENLSFIDATGNVIDIIKDPAWGTWFEHQCSMNRLVIVDTLRLAHQADENKSGEMSEVMAHLSAWAARGGAAILFLHHSNKEALREGTVDSAAAARGSSVIIDHSRCAYFLQRMTPDEATELADISRSNNIVGDEFRRYYIKFGVSKANASAPWPTTWLRSDPGGKLTAVTVERPLSVGKKGNSYDK